MILSAPAVCRRCRTDLQPGDHVQVVANPAHAEALATRQPALMRILCLSCALAPESAEWVRVAAGRRMGTGKGRRRR